ncbi:hypothetical protein TWF481_010950 [Arthrobotrys musiformis]|uniref:Uncharacterized protein n=1 Tax=Arthrobotrys musiformis TaxID=47236 RepID=A0AAV9VYU5_9PEZI
MLLVGVFSEDMKAYQFRGRTEIAHRKRVQRVPEPYWVPRRESCQEGDGRTAGPESKGGSASTIGVFDDRRYTRAETMSVGLDARSAYSRNRLTLD